MVVDTDRRTVDTAGPNSSNRAHFTFVDLFAGIGGIRLGLERAGGRCVYSVENDPHARQTYQANFGPLEHDDIRTINPTAIGDYEVLAAGFPCQPFSIAGVSKKNSLGRPHGFDDVISGNLFFSIRDLVGQATDCRVPRERQEPHVARPRPDVRADQARLDGSTALGAPRVMDPSRWVPQRRSERSSSGLHKRSLGRWASNAA